MSRFSRRHLAISGCIGVLLLAGCGGPPEGADDSVALVRGTSTTDTSNLDRCLAAAGYTVAADEVEARTLGNGDAFHVVHYRAGGDEVRFTVVPDRQLVFSYADTDAATLDRIGCSIDGKPLNENTGT